MFFSEFFKNGSNDFDNKFVWSKSCKFYKKYFKDICCRNDFFLIIKYFKEFYYILHKMMKLRWKIIQNALCNGISSLDVDHLFLSVLIKLSYNY